MGTTIKKPMKIPLHISDVLDPFWDPSSVQIINKSRNLYRKPGGKQMNEGSLGELRETNLVFRRSFPLFCYYNSQKVDPSDRNLILIGFSGPRT